MNPIPTMISLISVLWTLLSNLPSLLAVLKDVPTVSGILKAVLDIVGKDNLRMLLEALQNAAKKIKAEIPPVSDSPVEKTKRSRRLRQHIAQQLLGISDQQMAMVIDNPDTITTGTA